MCAIGSSGADAYFAHRNPAAVASPMLFGAPF